MQICIKFDVFAIIFSFRLLETSYTLDIKFISVFSAQKLNWFGVKIELIKEFFKKLNFSEKFIPKLPKLAKVTILRS